MAYRENEYRRHLSFLQVNNNMIMLISVNLVIFVMLIAVKAFYYLQYQNGPEVSTNFQHNVVSLFALPADLHMLLRRPWTILTHMFVHVDLWHALGNMLWLWAFGYILQDLTGNKKIFPVYFYGAIGGAIVFILAFNLLPGLRPALPYATAIGASAGVMAIAAAVTTISPGYRILPMLNGGIPIWIVTVFYLIIDLASIPMDNPGGHIAHLAGALTGYLFVVSYRRGYDWGAWINNFFEWVGNLFNPDRPVKGRTIKEELFYKSNTRPYKKTPNITEQRIDEILDKISQKGYHALSDEEIDLLKRASGK